MKVRLARRVDLDECPLHLNARQWLELPNADISNGLLCAGTVILGPADISKLVISQKHPNFRRIMGWCQIKRVRYKVE